MTSGPTYVLILFVIGFAVGYVVTRHRARPIRVQAAMLLGFVLASTPVIVGQVADLL